MKRKVRKKQWHDRRCQKLNKKNTYRKFYYSAGSKNIIQDPSSDNNSYQITQSKKSAPAIFSLIENTEETMGYFTNITDDIINQKYKHTFFIDSSNVTFVSVDALIYLIAIMRNIRLNKKAHNSFSGNLPKAENALQLYKESGFMSFVHSRELPLPASNNKMKIKSGLNNDPVIGKSICQFVMEKLNKTQIEILPLSKVLIELMSNVYHHAYNDNELMEKNWYLYAEHVDNSVRFIFVDTGAGIPKTVRKKWTEKIRGILGYPPSDGDLILSTLNGDFRTETGEDYRGNGLSGVQELVSQKPFCNFKVISGKGYCHMNDINKTLIKYDYNNRIYGTIYSFEIK